MLTGLSIYTMYCSKQFNAYDAHGKVQLKVTIEQLFYHSLQKQFHDRV